MTLRSAIIGGSYILEARLPESEQERVARTIREAMESIEVGALWRQKFADSEDVLEMLHDDALREHQAGILNSRKSSFARKSPSDPREPVRIVCCRNQDSQRRSRLDLDWLACRL